MNRSGVGSVSFTVELSKAIVGLLKDKFEKSQEVITIEYDPKNGEGPYKFECALKEIVEYEQKDGNHEIIFNRCKFITPIPKDQ